MVWALTVFMVRFTPGKSGLSHDHPVTVVICARNEATNLKKNLPSVLEQDYPDYEVIVVNDHSTDDTGAVLGMLKAQYSHLQVIAGELGDSALKGKKQALALGIREASHELLLLTDADCRPSSSRWIRQMVRNFDAETDIILGYGPYLREGHMLNKLQRFETFFTGMQYLSLAMLGLPYMGVGRNLAYRKTLFSEGDGFGCFGGLVSGDDDLFVNRLAKGTNTTVELSPESFTYSVPKEDWKQWFRQKIRHFSTAKHYKWKHKLVMSVLASSKMLFLTLSVIMLIAGQSVPEVLTLLGVYTLINWFSLGKKMMKLKEYDLIPFIPVLDWMYFVFLWIFTPAVIINRNTKWA